MNSANGSLGLDDQLCFALYSATNAITRAYRAPLQAIGLTYPQYLAMLVLWERPGTHSVKGLADRLDLDSSTLTPLLKRLADAGLVQRQRDSRDERVVRIGLTAQGEALKDKAALIQQDIVRRTRLDEETFKRLRDELRRLAEDIAKELDDASPPHAETALA